MQSQEINLMVLHEQHKDLIWELQQKEYRRLVMPKAAPLSHHIMHYVGERMVAWGSKLQHYGASQRTMATAKH